MGGGGVIGEGDVQWMTAGSGLLHKEYHEEEFNRQGGVFQMVQLWVNLPAKHKMTDPKYQAITSAEMARYELPEGGLIEVIAGEFKGASGPATTFSPVHLYNAKPKKGTSFTLEFPANYTTAILAIEGSAKLNGMDELPTDNLAVFKNDGEIIIVEANENSVLLVMSGEPLGEPIAQYGPFLMNTREEIIEAINDFQSGKYGHLDD
jgi:redox-sensitive bicupin YhaK (pirin superfamily)